MDATSIIEFEADEANNLYKLWNRMSAGAYLPLPVRAVDIPKDHGEGVRRLGVPTVVDRIAQTAAAMLLEEAGADLPPRQRRLPSWPGRP